MKINKNQRHVSYPIKPILLGMSLTKSAKVKTKLIIIAKINLDIIITNNKIMPRLFSPEWQ